MNSSEIIKINRLQNSLDTVNSVISSLKDEYEKLRIYRQELSDNWTSDSSELYLSRLDKQISDLSVCIGNAEGIYSKLKNHIDNQTDNLKNINML